MKLHEYTTLILGNHNDENGENCSPKNNYTLELRDKRVIQCRTLRNKSYELDPEIRGFVGSWLETVVHRNKKPGKKARKSVA